MATSNKVPRKALNVLLIGNNPATLSEVHDQLEKSRYIDYVAETVFNPKSVSQKIKKFKPDCIVIDDDMEKKDMSRLMDKLKKSSNSKKLPITIIKNSNRDDLPRDGADEFILKDAITTETLSHALLNSLKLHDMKDYLKQAYIRRKSILGGLK